MLKQHRALTAALIFTLGTTSFVTAAQTRVLVPDATSVPVHLVAPVNSSENHVGDLVPFVTESDVVVSGWVIIPGGSKGEGHITRIDLAGGHGHPGTLDMVCDWVVSADGGKIRLQPAAFEAIGKTSHGGATVAGIFTYGLASNAVRGGDAVINETRTLNALIAGPVHVHAVKRATSGDGFDH